MKPLAFWAFAVIVTAGALSLAYCLVTVTPAEWAVLFE